MLHFSIVAMRHTLKSESLKPSQENRETKISCGSLQVPRKPCPDLESHHTGEQDRAVVKPRSLSLLVHSPHLFVFPKRTPGTLSYFTQHSFTLGSYISTCFPYFRPKCFLTSGLSPRPFLQPILLGHISLVTGARPVTSSVLIDLGYDTHSKGLLCVQNVSFCRHSLMCEG